ncbi:MAG: MATE family efflux transporter [Planctomycetaceae bacterium]|nr:MATE family efflux transporter [Planctomycetaceae bacterium]
MESSSPEPNSPQRASPSLRRLALPSLVEQGLVFLMGLVDTWLAGRIGTNASAAVGLSAYVDWLASLLFLSVGVGTSAVVARHWGAGEQEEANRAASQAVPLGIGAGCISGILIFSLAPLFADLQGLSGMSPETYEIGVTYLRISALSHVFSSVVLAGNAALRGSGDMRTPMSILAIMNLANVLVSSALVFGIGVPSVGTKGIVLGTFFARIVGAIVMTILMTRNRKGVHWEQSWLKPRGEWAARMMRIGLPALADGLLTWVGHFLFIMVIARLSPGDLGKAYYAAHMVGMNIEALTYLPAVAWGTAAASLIGQSLGAGDPVRAWRIGQRAVFQCGFFAAGAAVFYYFGADFIFQTMHTDPLVRQVGPPALRYISIYQIPLVALIIYTQALRGAGDTRYPMLFTILGTLMIRVPTAYLCGIVWGGGLIGAWTGMMADVTFRCVLASVRYYRGGWTGVKV